MFALSGATALVAQCGWQVAAGACPGVMGDVRATHTWDPDGAGPQPAVLVVGGAFQVAGDVATRNLASYDEQTKTWQALGSVHASTFAPSVGAIGTMPNGDLVVAGSFETIGGVPAANIARFDGTTWSELGGGIDGAVHALTAMPNGDLVAGGAFSLAGSAAVGNVARWDGASWSAVGAGVAWPGNVARVRALDVMANGDLVAGGWFTQAGSVPAVGIARFDGSAWSALGGGLNSAAYAFERLANGDLVVGGSFGTAGGQTARGLARWDGSGWSEVGGGILRGGLIGEVRCIEELPGGLLLVAGDFTDAGGQPMARVGLWDGNNWSALGAGIDGGEVLTAGTLPSGSVVIGGDFDASGGRSVSNIAVFRAGGWQRLNKGIDGRVRVVELLDDGDLVIAGDMHVVGDVDVRGVARWNGSSWSALGDGLESDRVVALQSMANGDLVAAGSFVEAGGVFADGVARWDGTHWMPMGQLLGGSVTSLLRRSNGQMLATGSGQWGLRSWNGSSWVGFAGAGGVASAGQPTFQCVIETPDGGVIVGGDFSAVAGVSAKRVAQFDGAVWRALGTGLSNTVGTASVYDFALAPDDTVVAVGSFTSAGGVVCNGVARWDGSSWSSFGSVFPPVDQTYVQGVEVLPNGDVIVLGHLNLPGAEGYGVARWNGTAWIPVQVDLWVPDDLALARDGTLWIGGTFATFGGIASPRLARLDPQCPAPVADLGGGCSGNVLRAEQPAWLGSHYRARGTGLPDPAIVPCAYGFSPTMLPLSNVLAQALPGCDLLVTADFVALGVANGGELVTSLAIPATGVLVGVTLYQQLVPFELDGSGNIVSVGASNALRITVGSL